MNMADETSIETSQPTTEPVQAAPETSAAVEGENQQGTDVQSTESPSETQPETSPDAPEVEEWNGNDVEKLPKPLQARAKGMLRYLQKVSQEAAAVKQQAQAYQELNKNPEFQEFIKWKEERLNSPSQSVEQSSDELPISEDDFLAAQVDPKKFVEVQQRLAAKQSQPILQKLQGIENKIQTYEKQVQREQAERSIDAFAKQHPDFWDIHPVIMKATLQEVTQAGGTIEQAYQQAKTLEKQYFEKAQGKIKSKVEEKKKAVSAAPSKSMDPEVVYVSNRQEANRIAFENARLGKRVDVRVKK
jgi:hypothetical protein